MFNKFSIRPLRANFTCKLNCLQDFIFKILSLVIRNQMLKSHAHYLNKKIHYMWIYHREARILFLVIKIIMWIISIFFWINLIFKVVNFFAFNLKCSKKLFVGVKNWETYIFLVNYLRFSFLISFECRFIWAYLIFFWLNYILRWNNIDLFSFNIWVFNWNILKNFNLIIF